MPEQPFSTQYLRVIGRLYPDRQLRLRPGYLTSSPPWSDLDGDSPLRAETLDEQDRLLGSFPLRLASLCQEGGRSEDAPQAVRGFVPFHPRAQRVTFSYRGQILHEVRRSVHAPRVQLAWQPEGEVTGIQEIRWSGGHPDGESLQFFLRYSHDGGESWNRVSLRTNDPGLTLDFNQLPGGERCLLAVVATDGINTAIDQSLAFQVPRKPCRAFILNPIDGDVIQAGEPIRLEGQGAWLETRQPELEQLTWLANEERIGAGARVELRLPAGEHVITLLAGPEEYQGRAEARVIVLDENSAREEQKSSTQPPTDPGDTI